MSGIKPLIREVKQAVMGGFAHAKDKLHQVADNLTSHVDDVARRVRDQDHFDGPGGTGRGNTPSPAPYRPDMSRKPSGMSDAEYLRLLDESVHNPDGLAAVLGKFNVPGTDSYVDVAEAWDPPATYFSLGDQWGDIAAAHGLDDAGMFDAFNIPFLQRMISEGKPIHFSHNPLDFPGSALDMERLFLRDNGFEFVESLMQAVRR